VSAGNHSRALTAENAVFTWGGTGCLGHGERGLVEPAAALRGWVHSDSRKVSGTLKRSGSRPSDSRLRLIILWGGAGAPGGTVRRAAVRKRGSGSTSLY